MSQLPTLNRLRPFFCLLVAATLSSGAVAEEFRPGEPVGFPYDGNWYVGTVVAVELGQIKIRAEVGGETSEGIFPLRNVVRPPGTSGFRFWSDASKSFRVKAALVDIAAGKVRLRKEDGSEVSVPVSRLSDADQRFAERARKAKEQYLAANPPPSESTEDATSAAMPSRSSSRPSSPARRQVDFGPVPEREPKRVIDFDATPQAVIDYAGRDVTDPNVPMKLDPSPLEIAAAPPIVLPDGVVRYPIIESEITTWVVPADAESGLALCGVSRQTNKPVPAAFRWVSFTKQSISRPVPLNSDEHLFDYDLESQRALFANTENTSEGYWAIYDLPPGTLEPTLAVRITPSGWKGAYVGEPWARLLPNHRVVISARRGYSVVDYETGQVVLRVQLSDYGRLATPQLSPDRRYLLFQLVNANGHNRIIVDLQQSQVVHSTPMSDARSECFSEDGRFLISAVGARLVWYDVQSWQPVRQQPFCSTFALGYSSIHVLNDRFALDSAGRLLDLETHYAFVHLDVKPFGAGRLREDTWMQGERALVAANHHKGNAVASLKLPTPNVESFLDELKTPGRFDILGAGSPIRVSVAGSPHSDRVRKILETLCQANGWTVSPSSPYVLEADLPIQAEVAQAQAMRAQMGVQDSQRPPSYYRLSLKRDKSTLWTTGQCYLVGDQNGLAYAGRLEGESDQGIIPAGLSIPKTITDVRTQSGRTFILHSIKPVLTGRSPTSFQWQMGR